MQSQKYYFLKKKKKLAAGRSFKKSETKKKVPVQIPKDGLKIMTMLKKRDRGTDHILSRSFKTVSKTGKGYVLKTIEKRVNLKGKGGFSHKVVIRNLNYIRYRPGDESILATLAWHYNNGQINRWEKI